MPYWPTTSRVGMIASPREIIRRTQGAILKCVKPSRMICPAIVPVSVEFCPEASRARANSGVARPTPISGVSSLYALWMSADLVVAAAVKDGGGQDEDGGVDEQGQHQGDRRVGDRRPGLRP